MNAMKKVLTLLFALLMVFSLAACGSKDDGQSDVNDQAPPAANGQNDAPASPDVPASDEPQAPAGPAPQTKAESKYVLAYQGCALPANADFAPLLAYLGDPANYFEAESCAFEGLDKTYTYDGVEIVTYPDGDVDRISSVRILTNAVSTPEGITIGSTPEDVTAAYGEEYDAIGQQYTYEDGDCLLSVLFQDGKAISVEYTALNDLLG
ncbi:MAG: hypothetical protein K2O45_16880 [Oscillospiraceae bacterium]|nr:hypothetical protein [Oscillospiraceae bacterium]